MFIMFISPGPNPLKSRKVLTHPHVPNRQKAEQLDKVAASLRSVSGVGRSVVDSDGIWWPVSENAAPWVQGWKWFTFEKAVCPPRSHGETSERRDVHNPTASLSFLKDFRVLACTKDTRKLAVYKQQRQTYIPHQDSTRTCDYHLHSFETSLAGSGPLFPALSMPCLYGAPSARWPLPALPSLSSFPSCWKASSSLWRKRPQSKPICSCKSCDVASWVSRVSFIMGTWWEDQAPSGNLRRQWEIPKYLSCFLPEGASAILTCK